MKKVHNALKDVTLIGSYSSCGSFHDEENAMDAFNVSLKFYRNHLHQFIILLDSLSVPKAWSINKAIDLSCPLIFDVVVVYGAGN